LTKEVGTGDFVVAFLGVLVYIGIGVGSIVSVVKHPFKSWVSRIIKMMGLLIFEVPASCISFIFRPRCFEGDSDPTFGK
jgi:hypothetical protein